MRLFVDAVMATDAQREALGVKVGDRLTWSGTRLAVSATTSQAEIERRAARTFEAAPVCEPDDDLEPALFEGGARVVVQVSGAKGPRGLVINKIRVPMPIGFFRRLPEVARLAQAMTVDVDDIPAPSAG